MATTKPKTQPTVKQTKRRARRAVNAVKTAGDEARKAIIAADLLTLESGQARLAGMSKGAYGSPTLRSGGSSVSSRYRIGTGTSGASKPKAKPKGKPRSKARPR